MELESTVIKTFMDYGAMGLFVAYLVYDRVVLLKDIRKVLEDNHAVLQSIAAKLNGKKK